MSSLLLAQIGSMCYEHHDHFCQQSFFCWNFVYRSTNLYCCMIISLFHQGNSHVTLAGRESEIEKFRVVRGKVEEISTVHHYSVIAAKYQVIM